MDPHTDLSPHGHYLAQSLHRAQNNAHGTNGAMFHVGSTTYLANQHMQSAADYTERHLLLRVAIERFLRRSVSFKKAKTPRPARKLIIELTNARHIISDAVPAKTVESINYFVAQYINFYRASVAYNGIPPAVAAQWTYHIASTAIERLLQPQEINDAFIDFTYHHYLAAINQRDFPGLTDNQFAAAVFCAMQQAVFHADKATTLSCWVSLPRANDQSLNDFVHACQIIDDYFDSPITNKLSRLINRYGAPVRALRELIGRQPNIDLYDRKQFLSELELTTTEQYEITQRRLVHSIKRAVLFIATTQLLISMFIGIPLDLLFLGYIAFVPLYITLFVPAVYLMSASYSLRLPSIRNTHTILDYAERMIYPTNSPVTYKLRVAIPPKNRVILNVIYTILILGVLSFFGWALARIGLHVMHSILFILLLLIAGLLRFRIVQTARELEIVDRQQSMFGVVGDMLYLPFTHIGQWLGDSHHQVNLFAYTLDRAIAMPIKTIFVSLTTWAHFMRRREQI